MRQIVVRVGTFPLTLFYLSNNMSEEVFVSPFPPVPLPRRSVFTHILGSSPSAPDLVGGFPATSPAFIDAVTGVTLSRGQLRSYALQLAYTLRNLPDTLRHSASAAVRPTILIFSPNSMAWPVMIYGAAAAGFCVTLANSAYIPDELRHQYTDSCAHLMFVHPSLLGVAQTMLRSTGCSDLDMRGRIILATSGWLTGVPDTIPTNSSGFVRLENLLSRGELTSEVSFDDHRSDETVYLCYSSGTTGIPKGVETTHFNVTSLTEIITHVWPKVTPCLAPSVAEAKRGRQPDVYLGSLPYYHIYGAIKLLHVPLASGTPTVVIAGFDPEKFLEAVDRHRATFILVVPPILVVLARHPAITKYDLTSLRVMLSGAAPLSSELAETVERRLRSVGADVVITQAYGLTETSPTITALPLEYARERVGSVGLPVSNIEIRLVREDEGEVLTDIEGAGELWVRGPSIMKGYLDNPVATAAAITVDGWFKTGDVAVRDKDGFLKIVDRRKELIKYKGFQVPPAELESLLLQHPDVADAAVIGVVCQEEETELPRAYVVPARAIPTGDDATFALGVQGWIAGRVAPHKRLRGGVVLVEQIPKSAAGKILRRELRDRAKSVIAFGQAAPRARL